MPLYRLPPPQKLLNPARRGQNERRVGLGAVLVVGMVASASMWALVLQYLLRLWS